MTDTATAMVKAEFIRYIRHLASRVDRAARALPPDKLWTRPFEFGNSVGVIIRHLTGNLNHYVGALIGGSGYVRERQREFDSPDQPPGPELLAEFHRAIELVTRTIESMTPEKLAAPIGDQPPIETVFGLLLMCTAHLNNHIGQMSYLVKALGHDTGEPPMW